MKNIIIITILLLLGVDAFCQGGVNFEPLTFKEALAKAKKEKKLVFMDCYTAWCGPCRYMAEKIFPQERAGRFFNPKFISVKFDMEKGEGVELAKKYGVRSFPTFFILHPSGAVQHKVVGANELDEFIARIGKGLNENTALGDLGERYESGRISKDQLIAYQVALIHASEKSKIKKVGKELDAMLKNKDRQKKEYWPVLREKPYGTVDFRYVLDNTPIFYKNMGKEEVERYLYSAFLEAINNTLRHKAKKPVENLTRMREELVDSPLGNKTKLISSIDLNLACFEGNVDKAVEIARESITNERGEVWQTVGALNLLRAGAAKEDLGKIMTLEDRFMSVFEGSESYVKNYFDELRLLAYKGISFQNLGYNAALKKANEQVRGLFIVCHTASCNSCKYMAEEVYENEEVGNFLNNRFLSIRIDKEKEDGPKLIKAFDVHTFPAFIILNSDGTLRGKFTGTYGEEAFIRKIQECLVDHNF